MELQSKQHPANFSHSKKASAFLGEKSLPFFKSSIQPRLTVNQPHDVYEQEADAMADKMMRMPDHSVIGQAFFKPAVSSVQRKCAHCEEEEQHLQRKETDSQTATADQELTAYIGGLSGSGQPLPNDVQRFFEPRFGYNFSHVKVHTDAVAAKSAQSINALAYTSGSNVVFNNSQYSPGTDSGKRLLAHELTHVVQQGINTPSYSIQRLCSAPGVCSAPIAGSATDFGTGEEAVEAGPRARRKRMSPARALSSGHGGRARSLETFLQGQFPGRLSTVQGIFIDWDMSAGTGAFTMNCADWISSSLPPATVPPGMAGAINPCIFVHGELNQQAFAFNNGATVIGGLPREQWRINTLQTLTHETQHVIFDTAVHPAPAGITTPTCTRAAISFELSELSAQLSEFPIVFRAIPAGAPAADPSRVRLANWFNSFVNNPWEGLKGILATIGCSCECAEVDAFVTDTFNFTASSWSAAERSAFNTELQRPVWGIGWPVSP